MNVRQKRRVKGLAGSQIDGEEHCKSPSGAPAVVSSKDPPEKIHSMERPKIMVAARPCHGTSSLHYVVQLGFSRAVELSVTRKLPCNWRDIGGRESETRPNTMTGGCPTVS